MTPSPGQTDTAKADPVRRHLLTLMLALGVAILVSVTGCGTEEREEPTRWAVNTIWPRGTHPVPNPDGSAELFLQEESPAGLYLLSGGTATRLNPAGPDVRPDYSWSADGQWFCFSSPAEPGDPDAGVFVARRSQPMQFERLWDRGSHPCFTGDGTAIICSGPEDGSESEGLWYISLSNHNRSRLAPRGVRPKVSPDGLKIAYLLTAGVAGRTLVVLDVETVRRDTLTGEVLNYSWLGDSRSLVFEHLRDGVQSVSVVSASGGAPVPVAQGTLPAGFPSGSEFVYTGLQADRAAGLWIAAVNRTPQQISARGTWAAPADMNRIFAQDSTGIIELTR